MPGVRSARSPGGEQQRLLIAQALVSEPRLLILDEPLDSLDLPNQSAVAALLERISREQGVAVLLVAHDVNPLLAYLDRVVYFGAGRAVVGEPREVIEAGVLSRLYGVPVEVLQTADGRLVVVGAPEAPAHHSDRHAPWPLTMAGTQLVAAGTWRPVVRRWTSCPTCTNSLPTRSWCTRCRRERSWR